MYIMQFGIGSDLRWSCEQLGHALVYCDRTRSQLGLACMMLFYAHQLPSQSFFLHRHQYHLSTWLLLRDTAHLPDANSCSSSASGYVSLVELLFHGSPCFSSSRVQPLSYFFTGSPREPSRCRALLQVVLSSRRKPLQHSPLFRNT